MNNMIHHTTSVLHYDGLLHWCFLLALAGLAISLIWVFVRVLLPLRSLVRQANRVMGGDFTAFDTPAHGIREVEQLRRALHHMIGQIEVARERESAYRTALTESQEHERLRIAREIHDDTIQSLILVSHSIERAAQAVDSAQQAVVTQLEAARGQLVAAIDCLRQLIGNLRPTVLDELGLVVALETLCEKQPRRKFAVRGSVQGLESPVELALFRAAQEAIRNADRHAHARHVTVTLRYEQAVVILEVADDGVGFRVPRQLQEFASHGHFGLMGMRERIQHIGGRLHLTSEPGEGTKVVVILPVVRHDTQTPTYRPETMLPVIGWA